MSDKITYLDFVDDEDKTVFQTEEDIQRIQQEISGLTDEDTTEIEVTHQMTQPSRPYWQEVFG